MYQGGNPDKLRVLALIPPGVAAFNINGTTINSGLNVSCLEKLMPLSYKNQVELINEYL